MGLQYGHKYDSTKGLRYGHLMIMSDQDHDGSHIKGLLLNFLHHFWPSLLKLDGFLREFITPIVKAVKGRASHTFFTLPEYFAWKEAATAGERSAGRLGQAARTRDARSARSIVGTIARVLAAARQQAPHLPTKSGLMLGLGETAAEVEQAMADLRAVDCQRLTLGQYLRPSLAHLPVARYWQPEEFEALAETARRLGFAQVRSGPLVRSSYHAAET
jgi:DNA gyrase/topoisomerase IV subunit B